MKKGNTWVIILAGGEGRRLKSLTTTASGISIPKQFCSLQGESSLLQDTLRRAHKIAPDSRICAVVAAEHRQWWQDCLTMLSAENIIVEPERRGTAIGILIALLHVVTRDPDASIVLTPSDQFVADEPTLTHAITHAVAYVSAQQNNIVILGIEPDEPDPELGYILPGKRRDLSAFDIAAIVEKPDVEYASELIADGALWNSFVIVAAARTFLGVFEEQFPTVVMKMRNDICSTVTASNESRLHALYQSLPTIDFSKDILERNKSRRLRVLPLAPCGWTDLGTPRRVTQLLRHLPDHARTSSTSLNLAEQCRRMQRSQQMQRPT